MKDDIRLIRDIFFVVSLNRTYRGAAAFTMRGTAKSTRSDSQNRGVIVGCSAHTWIGSYSFHSSPPVDARHVSTAAGTQNDDFPPV